MKYVLQQVIYTIAPLPKEVLGFLSVGSKFNPFSEVISMTSSISLRSMLTAAIANVHTGGPTVRMADVLIFYYYATG